MVKQAEFQTDIVTAVCSALRAMRQQGALTLAKELEAKYLGGAEVTYQGDRVTPSR